MNVTFDSTLTVLAELIIAKQNNINSKKARLTLGVISFSFSPL